MKKHLIIIATITIASTLLYARKRIPDNMPQKIIQLVQKTYTKWEFPFTHSTYQRKHLEEKPIVIIIPSYNNAQWYKNNIESVLIQEYTNYRVIYIADGCDSD